MRVYLNGFTPGQQQLLMAGVIQILDAAGRLHEDWMITGRPRNVIVQLHAKQWFGRIRLGTFDRELPHLLRRFREWLRGLPLAECRQKPGGICRPTNRIQAST